MYILKQSKVYMFILTFTCFPLHWFTEFREVDADEKGRIYNDPPYKTFKWILEISSHQSHQRNNYIQQ